MQVTELRGVAIFAKDFSGHPARKISKNHATANAFGCPDSSCYARFNPTRG
jgi:Uri superfamily endonuclease